MCIFGVFGFFGSFIGERGDSSSQVGRFYDQKTFVTINGVFVDGRGNIYFGQGGHGSIQVYDNKGSFLYRISFPTSGGIWRFYVDEYDMVHILVLRGRRLLAFFDGNLVVDRTLTTHENGHNMLGEFENMARREFVDNFRNTYIKGFNGNIRVYNENGDFLRNISPSSVIWIFHPSASLAIGTAGSIILISLHSKKIFKPLHKGQDYERNPPE